MEEKSTHTDSTNQAKILYTWQALEFSKAPSRSTSWYLIVGGLWLVWIIYAIYLKDWLRLGLAILLGVIVWFVIQMKPKEFRHEITETGLTVGKKSYPFSRFKGFGIVQSVDGDRLVVLSASRLNPSLSLQLGGADVELVRATMARFLSEEQQQEDLIDQMNRLFRL